MKTFILSLGFFLFCLNATDACRCVILREFGQTLDQNDQIFIGKVLSEYATSDTVKFHLNVQKKWKGKFDLNSTVIINTSTGSCGMEFEIGETYIVYAKNNYTNICRRNKKVSESFDERLLDHYFHGKAIEKQLDELDQEVLRNKLQMSKAASSSQDKIVIVYDYRILSPIEIYKLNPLNFNEKNYTSLTLNEEDRSEIGDCIEKVIVMGSYTPSKGWNKKKALKAVKKKKVCT